MHDYIDMRDRFIGSHMTKFASLTWLHFKLNFAIRSKVKGSKANSRARVRANFYSCQIINICLADLANDRSAFGDHWATLLMKSQKLGLVHTSNFRRIQFDAYNLSPCHTMQFFWLTFI